MIPDMGYFWGSEITAAMSWILKSLSTTYFRHTRIRTLRFSRLDDGTWYCLHHNLRVGISEYPIPRRDRHEITLSFTPRQVLRETANTWIKIFSATHPVKKIGVSLDRRGGVHFFPLHSGKPRRKIKA